MGLLWAVIVWSKRAKVAGRFVIVLVMGVLLRIVTAGIGVRFDDLGSARLVIVTVNLSFFANCVNFFLLPF